MLSLKVPGTRDLPFRVALKISLVAGLLVIVPLYAVLAWEEFGYPMRGALKGLSLLLFTTLCGWVAWRLLRRSGFRRGGPGAGPGQDGPMVREPRPPGGRPPTLTAAARLDRDEK